MHVSHIFNISPADISPRGPRTWHCRATFSFRVGPFAFHRAMLIERSDGTFDIRLPRASPIAYVTMRNGEIKVELISRVHAAIAAVSPTVEAANAA